MIDREYKRNLATNMVRSLSSAELSLDLAKKNAKSLGDNKLSKVLEKMHLELVAMRTEVKNRFDPTQG